MSIETILPYIVCGPVGIFLGYTFRSKFPKETSFKVELLEPAHQERRNWEVAVNGYMVAFFHKEVQARRVATRISTALGQDQNFMKERRDA